MCLLECMMDYIFLVLFGHVKNDVIYNRIRYLISQKSDNTFVISHSYAKIKINSYDYLPLKSIDFT